jgi:hypothetical protein
LIITQRRSITKFFAGLLFQIAPCLILASSLPAAGWEVPIDDTPITKKNAEDFSVFGVQLRSDNPIERSLIWLMASGAAKPRSRQSGGRPHIGHRLERDTLGRGTQLGPKFG